MEGIAEMFDEYSRLDEYQLQFDFERYAAYRCVQQREAQQRHDSKPSRRAAKRKWAATYYRQRRRNDPTWASQLRARQNAYNRGYRARRREQGVKCARCASLRVDGRTLCQRHLEWERERGAKRRAA
jgi:hypothetical protein